MASDSVDPKKENRSSPHGLRKYGDDIRGWRARVKVLASSTLSGAFREEGAFSLVLSKCSVHRYPVLSSLFHRSQSESLSTEFAVY